jgi:hypothetical protein
MEAQRWRSADVGAGAGWWTLADSAGGRGRRLVAGSTVVGGRELDGRWMAVRRPKVCCGVEEAVGMLGAEEAVGARCDAQRAQPLRLRLDQAASDVKEINYE